MKQRIKSRGRLSAGGFTILELLIVIALLAPLGMLSGRLYVSTSRLHEAQMQSLDRLLMVQEIEREFREAVRGATGVLDSIGPFVRGESVLILDGPTELGAGARTVFHLIGDARHLVKTTFVPVATGGWEQRDETYALAVKGLSFAFQPGERHVTLHFRARLDAGERRRWTPGTTVVAALRGAGEIAP